MAAARTIGDIADEVLALQVKIKKKEDEVEELEAKRKALLEELKLAADGAQLTSGGGKKSKFTIELETVPHIADWDAFCAYMKDNSYFHLVQRRPGSKACQELWNLGTQIPGIDKFSQHKVRVKGV